MFARVKSAHNLTCRRAVKRQPADKAAPTKTKLVLIYDIALAWRRGVCAPKSLGPDSGARASLFRRVLSAICVVCSCESQLFSASLVASHSKRKPARDLTVECAPKARDFRQASNCFLFLRLSFAAFLFRAQIRVALNLNFARQSQVAVQKKTRNPRVTNKAKNAKQTTF